MSAATVGEVTEIDAEEKLASFREASNLYRGPSFDTIAGAGAHGAVVHYRATRTTNRRLEMGQLFLLDSGGQYLDGTTDVTRTLAIGEPTREMRDRFTRVLKGHIALGIRALSRRHRRHGGSSMRSRASICGPKGSITITAPATGSAVISAGMKGRRYLSKRSRTALRSGMVVSNEPGYYKTGAYGIRIENLQAVVLRRRQRSGPQNAGLRDAHFGAHRPPPDRPRDADLKTKSRGLRATMVRAHEKLSAAARCRNRRVARRGDAGDLVNLRERAVESCRAIG